MGGVGREWNEMHLKAIMNLSSTDLISFIGPDSLGYKDIVSEDLGWITELEFLTLRLD